MSPADIAFHPDPSRFPGQIWSVEIVNTNNPTPEMREVLETIRVSGLFDAEYGEHQDPWGFMPRRLEPHPLNCRWRGGRDTISQREA
jgi:hypothetical protein